MASLGRSLTPVTELGPRAARRSRASVRGRLRRLRQRLFFIGQCAVAAGFAWWFAVSVLHHSRPFFAPVAAIVCLGMSFGHRLRRVAEVVIGVAIGVGVGDAFVHLAGTGVWQIIAIVAVSMTVAVLLDTGLLLVIQAGVQSVVVATVAALPGGPLNRWLDAAAGGLIALVATTVAPAAPLRKPRVEAAAVIAELASLLSSTARALRRHDLELARTTLARARASEGALDELRELSAEGIAVIRMSPFRRRHLPGVQAIADLLEPLDRAIRNTRVLVRRAGVALSGGEEVPPSYVDLLEKLSAVTSTIAREMTEHRLPVGSRALLAAVARDSAQVAEHPSLSAEVIRAQVRSVVVDLLMLTGLPYDAARSQVPQSEDDD
jgi:uncharacterized membrane protein YgaE (UPF0421/DUF939 family)